MAKTGNTHHAAPLRVIIMLAYQTRNFRRANIKRSNTAAPQCSASHF
jgi:hypothetical protein